MNIARNVATTRQIYADFGRGDIPAILERIHPEVDWEFGHSHLGAIPWLAPGRGLPAVGAFFAALGSALRIEVFDVLAIMGDGDWVVALTRFHAVHLPTGRRLIEACEPHVWRFDEAGRVIAMRHAADSLHHAQVCGLVPRAGAPAEDLGAGRGESRPY